jgi:PAS domain S-box-containing protein
MYKLGSYVQSLRTLGVVMRPIVLLTVLLAAPAWTQNAVEHKRVLILFSTAANVPAQVLLENSLRKTILDGSPVPVEVYSEYLDDARTSSLDSYENELVSLLSRKYQGKTFDVVIPVTYPLLRFQLRNQAVLFPNSPKVFLTLDKSDLDGLDLGPNMTGVWGQTDFRSTLEMALGLHPGTEQVVVLGGVSDWDRSWSDKAKQAYLPFEDRIKFTYLLGLTSEEQRSTLAKLPPHTIVSFITSLKDKAGNTYENRDLLSRLAPVSSAPIYGVSDAQVGSGIVGGKVLDFEGLGVAGGRVCLRIMAGESASTIPPQGVPSVPMFDWRQLQRWGIDEDSLPEGSIVRYKTPTLWSEYKAYILPLVGAIVIETLLIAWLLFMRIQRRKAEAEASHLTSRIKEIVSNVPGIVWESRYDPEINKRRTTFISDYVEKMLGYSAEEWLSNPPGFGGVIMPEEDRERALRDSDEAVATRKDGLSEFRWITKDGRIRWVENYLSPIVDDVSGKVVGLRGVALDVTNRKAAEEKAYHTEKRDRAILSALPDLMFIQSDDGVYVDFHAKDLQDLLVPPEQFLGKNIRDILPPELGDRFMRAFAQTKDGGDPQVLEYSLEIGGSERWYEARMVRSADQILSIVRDITSVKRSQQEAYELGGRLINAQEDERSRLARELHDGVSQTLALLSIELSMFGKRSINGGAANIEAELKVLSERVSGVSDELRRISQELHPVKLAQLGLVTAVRSFCKEIETAHGVKVHFEETAVPNKLEDNVSLGLYRIVQESLQNVVKHSGARRASVKLALKGGELMLEVDDDGKGFNPAAARGNGSLGLVSMRERVRLLDGSIKIDSKIGKGTKVRAAIPAIAR